MPPPKRDRPRTNLTLSPLTREALTVLERETGKGWSELVDDAIALLAEDHLKRKARLVRLRTESGESGRA